MAEVTRTRRAIDAAYADTRYRAQSRSTWRLRLWERRLPPGSNDPTVLARRKAIRDELRDRGASL